MRRLSLKNQTYRFNSLVSGLLSTCLLVSTGLLPEIWLPQTAQSAEKIRLPVFGPLIFSISLASLENFAETGKLTGDLKTLASFFDEPTRALMRQWLQRRFQLSQVTVAHLTYSPMGREVLEQVGKVIQIPNQINGFYGLRAAVISAAAKAPAEGWTILDAMRQFPLHTIDINVSQLLALRQELAIYFQYNQAAVKAIQTEAAREAAAQAPIKAAPLADLSQPGPDRFVRETVTIKNPALRQTQTGLSVNYDFPVDVYVPQNLKQPAPIVIISHGFGALKENFTFLAEHLASYGFVVIVPEHVGSNLASRRNYYQGLLNTVLSPSEYLNRPQEVSFLIDELEQLVASDPTWAARLNLEQIGVYGDSLGGATVFSLAGADLNFGQLQQKCNRENLILNFSLYVQCQARFLPPTNYNLHEPRIKAAIAGHPLSSGLFGPENLDQIRIPLLIAAGSDDLVSPVVTEQIHPFIWIGSQPKYLALLAPGTHWSTKPAGGEGAGEFPKLLTGEHQDIGSSYFKELAVAFFDVYLRDRSEYLPYLTAAHARAISQGQPMTMDIIQSLTPEQLANAYGKAPPIPIIPAAPVADVTPARAESVLAEIQRTGVLKVAMRRDAPPFGYIDAQQQWSGYCNDFALALQQHLTRVLRRNLEVELVQLPSTPSDRFELVRQGTVHLECGPNTIRQEVEGVVFSEPLFVTGTRFLVASANQNRVNPSLSLEGIKVGVLRNTTTESFLQNRYPKADIIAFDGPAGRADAVQAVVRGDLTAFAGDSILSLAELQQQGVSLTNYPLLPQQPLTCEFYGAILPNTDPAWQRTVNGFIASQSAQSVWDKWFKQIAPYLLDELETCVNR